MLVARALQQSFVNEKKKEEKMLRQVLYWFIVRTQLNRLAVCDVRVSVTGASSRVFVIYFFLIQNERKTQPACGVVKCLRAGDMSIRSIHVVDGDM